MQNASEGMVLVTVGVIMPMIALSEVGRDKVAARRTCLNAGRQKVNRPNVAPMGVTSPPIHWWVVDSKSSGSSSSDSLADAFDRLV